MKYIFKGLFMAQLVFQLAAGDAVAYEELLLALFLIALHVFKERFWDSIYLVAAQFIIVTAAVYLGLPLGFMYALLAFDFSYGSAYIGVAFPAAGIIIFSLWSDFPLLPLLTGASAVFGYYLKESEKQHAGYSKSLDAERHLRYSLEITRKRLIASQQETVHLAEMKERNRIAGEIHDSLGHSIAGVLVQLQVAARQIGRDTQKARRAVELSAGALNEALTGVRETVYNLKPRAALGLEYVKRIVDDYSFCPVEFNCTGDFESIPAAHMETAASIIKEALTNTARYSKATRAIVNLETNQKFTRIMVLDNGVGCGMIQEGLGISVMKERVRNLGGSLVISSNDGFRIVCMLYNQAAGDGKQQA